MTEHTDIPLSYGQRALWFVQRLAPDATAYNVSLPARARGLDTAAFRTAWQALTDRHPALRTTFPAPAGQAVGRVFPRLEVDFAEEDASGWSAATVEQRLGDEAHRPFDLQQAPALRLRIFHLAGGETLSLLSLHHLRIDLSSLAVLVDELGAAYAAALAGAPLVLPAPPAPPGPSATYEEFVHWQAETLAGAPGEELWSFWRGRLAGSPPALALPADRPRPRVQTFRGGAREVVLGPGLTRPLKALAASEGVSLSTLLLAAFQALLHRYSGQQDVLVGCPVPGRGLPDFRDVVGYFVNTVVVRGDFAGRPGFREVLRRVHRRVEEALEHQDYPFPLLVERLRPPRDPGCPPLFQVLYALYQGEEERVSRLLMGQAGDALDLGGGLVLEPWPLPGRSAMLDLALLMSDAGDRIAASFQYNADLFEAATVARLASDFEAVLAAVLDDPDRAVASLPASLGEACRSAPPQSPQLPQVPPPPAFPAERADERAETRRALLERQKRARSAVSRSRP